MFNYLRLCLVALILAMSSLLVACTPYAVNYEGSWLGLDTGDGTEYSILRFDISRHHNDRYDIKVRRYYYKSDIDNPDYFVLACSNPYYAKGRYNAESGAVNTDFGQLFYNVTTFKLEFKDIDLVRGMSSNIMMSFLPDMQKIIKHYAKDAVFNERSAYFYAHEEELL